ncbi:hypothetical protein R1sor_016441 [Riccia sorocarpa]|uniref:BAH domain-containing protein n=1 Tax=Riccia sorocarpa TaxID=122646 RepID=A0ABD3HI91_9MARC
MARGGTPSDIEDDYGVRWGRLKGTGERFKFYHSFYLDGKVFSVNSFVLVKASDGPPYIARIVKLSENDATRKKYMSVRWFYRPRELPKGLPSVDYDTKCREIFIAIGNKYALSRINPACTIRKCRVVCIAQETWNRMPSDVKAETADYFFHRAFDPEKLKLRRLDPLKLPGSVHPGTEPKVSSIHPEPAERSREIGGRMFPGSKVPGLHSERVISGKPPRQLVDPRTDQTEKLKPSPKPSAFPSTRENVLQVVDSRKRPRVGAQEDDTKERRVLGGMMNDKDRSVVFPGRQESKAKLHASSKQEVEAREADIGSTMLAKGKLNSLSGKGTPLSDKDRALKSASLQAKDLAERKLGVKPLSSNLPRGNDGGFMRDGKSGETVVLGKRSREVSYPLASDKGNLAQYPRPEKRLKECHLGIKSRTMSTDTNSRINPMEIKSQIDAKIVRKEGKDLQKQVHQRPSVKPLGERGTAGVKRDFRPLGNCQVSRLESEDQSRKLKVKSSAQDGLQGATCRVDKHRVADVVGPPVDRGRPFSEEDHCNRYTPIKKIFKFPWEEKQSVEEAITKGRALLLKNLDPCLNSNETEAILEKVLRTTCDVRILPPKVITCYTSAEAVVIFRRTEIAQSALRTLQENVLVISDDERPVLASPMSMPDKSISNFHGFFNLEKFGCKANDSVDQNAGATSHCAQTNTVEYETGLLWRLLQDRDTKAWLQLEEDHQRELREVKTKYQKGKL